MNAFLMVIGLLLVGVTAVVVARIIVMPRVLVQDHLRSIDSYGFTTRREGDDTAEPSRGVLSSRLTAVAGLVGSFLLRVAPRIPAVSRKELLAAGYYDLAAETVHGYRAIATVAIPGVILLMASGGGGVSGVAALLILGLAALTWQGPAVLIRGRGRARLDQIDRALPQFIDLVVATVEAGTSFGGALHGAASRFAGPLGDELRLTMQQQNLGLSTSQAVSDMLDRCETPSVRAFVRAISRAESHGVSIGPMMRYLAHDIRQRRRDVARERIQKAPIKLMFPLVLLIMPALLLVIMFPALYNLAHILSTA
jgi:tight adherence protein C